jgi:hypothetical protein
MHSIKHFSIALACVFVLGPALAGPDVLVGVVEAQPDSNAEAAQAKDHLRVAFRYQGGRWAAVCEGKSSSRRNEGCDLPKADEPLSWNVVFDGQVLGPVETRGWRNSDYYSFTGALALATAPAPSVEDAAAPFAAWWGQPAHRPLVAVHGSSGRQSQSTWRHDKVRSTDAGLAWPFFKANVPTIPNCRFSDEGVPLGKPRPSTISDMTVFDRVQLTSGSVLLGVRAKGAEECAEESGFGSAVWVVSPARGKPFALAGFDRTGWAYSLRLVDVGDFAGYGASGQAVFYYSGYNEDGYILYYDNFRKHVDFTWGYH